MPGPPLDPGLVMVDPEAQAASHPAPGLQPDLPQQPPVSFPGAPPGHEINFANEVGNAFCFVLFPPIVRQHSDTQTWKSHLSEIKDVSPMHHLHNWDGHAFFLIKYEMLALSVIYSGLTLIVQLIDLRHTRP